MLRFLGLTVPQNYPTVAYLCMEGLVGSGNWEKRLWVFSCGEPHPPGGAGHMFLSATLQFVPETLLFLYRWEDRRSHGRFGVDHLHLSAGHALFSAECPASPCHWLLRASAGLWRSFLQGICKLVSSLVLHCHFHMQMSHILQAAVHCLWSAHIGH